MPTRLIELDNGLLVEVDVIEGEVSQISSGLADRVGKSVKEIGPVLAEIGEALSDTYQRLDKVAEVEKASIELGLSFEAEGNIFVTKATATSNFVVTLELKPRTKHQEL